MSFHAIEQNAKLHLQWLIPVLGIFHTWMAAVDAIWRMHIRDQSKPKNDSDTFTLFRKLQPKDASKLVSNPGYHVLNDGIQHLIWSHLTICWELVTGFQNLWDFGETDLSWDDIKLLAQRIFNEYIAKQTFQDLCRRPMTECDHRGKNQMLFNQDTIFYTLLVQTSNTGAVGLMKDLLWNWVPMFLACGKHKYATHLSKFLQDLHIVYPLQLASTIKNNWLCNPTGTVNGFMGVNWWIELNNLYTKVSYYHSSQK